MGDRDFYSDHNLELLSREGYKFTIPVPSNVAWQKRLIAEHRDTLVRPGNLIEENGSILYGKTIYKTTPAHGRTWHHLYFDPARKDKTIACFMQKLRALKDELEAEKLIESHMVMYELNVTSSSSRLLFCSGPFGEL